MHQRGPHTQEPSLAISKGKIADPVPEYIELFRNEKYKDAIRAASMELQINKHPMPFFVRGLSRIKFGMSELARNDLMEGIKTENQMPESNDSRIREAVLSCVLSYEKVFLQEYEKQILSSNQEKTNNKLKKTKLVKQARAAFIKKEYQKAIEFYDQVIFEDSCDAQIYIDRGLAYLHLTKNPQDQHVTDNFQLSAWVARTNFGLNIVDYPAKSQWMKTLSYLALAEFEKSQTALKGFCDILRERQSQANQNTSFKRKKVKKVYLDPILTGDYLDVHSEYLNYLGTEVFQTFPKEGFDLLIEMAEALYAKEKQFYEKHLDSKMVGFAREINCACIPSEVSSPLALVEASVKNQVNTEQKDFSLNPEVKQVDLSTTNLIHPFEESKQSYCRENFYFGLYNDYYNEFIKGGEKYCLDEDFDRALIIFKGALSFVEEGLTSDSLAKTIEALDYIKAVYVDNGEFYFANKRVKEWERELLDITTKILEKCESYQKQDPHIAKLRQLGSYNVQYRVYDAIKRQHLLKKEKKLANQYALKALEVKVHLDKLTAEIEKKFGNINDDKENTPVPPLKVQSISESEETLPNNNPWLKQPPLHAFSQGIALVLSRDYQGAYKLFKRAIKELNETNNNDVDFLWVLNQIKNRVMRHELLACENKLFLENSTLKKELHHQTKYDLVLAAKRNMTKKRYQNMIDCLSFAIQRDPFNPQLYADRALGHFLLNKNPQDVLDNIEMALFLCQSESQKLYYYWFRCRLFLACGEIKNSENDLARVLKICESQKKESKRADSGLVEKHITPLLTNEKYPLILKNLGNLFLSNRVAKLSSSEWMMLSEAFQKIHQLEKNQYQPSSPFSISEKSQIAQIAEVKQTKQKIAKPKQIEMPPIRMELAQEALTKLRKNAVFPTHAVVTKKTEEDETISPPIETVSELKIQIAETKDSEEEEIQPPSPRYEGSYICSANFFRPESKKNNANQVQTDPKPKSRKSKTDLTVEIPHLVAQCARLLYRQKYTVVEGGQMRDPLLGLTEVNPDADLLTWATKEQIDAAFKDTKFKVEPDLNPRLFNIVEKTNPTKKVATVYQSPYSTLYEHALHGDVTINDNWGVVDPVKDQARVLRFLPETKADLEAKRIALVNSPNVKSEDAVNEAVNKYIKILRAIDYGSRFQKLGFTLAEDIPVEMKSVLKELNFNVISGEHLKQINSMFSKLLTHGHALNNFKMLVELGVIQHAFPFLKEFVQKDQWDSELINLLNNIAECVPIKDIYASFINLYSTKNFPSIKHLNEEEQFFEIALTKNPLMKLAFNRYNKPYSQARETLVQLARIYRVDGPFKFFRRKLPSTSTKNGQNKVQERLTV